MSAHVLYEKKFMVKFGETDPQGIMYFNHFSRIAHECLEDFLSQTSEEWDYWFRNSKFAVPIKKCRSDFFKPLIVGQKYTACLTVADLQESSITFNCEFKKNKILYAKTITTHVFVDIKTFKKVSLPKRVKKIFDITL